MRLNLGCGPDIRQGYTNVDLRPARGVDEVADLSKLPWFYKDESVDEILMLDFLEHFPYAKTLPILNECWRILKTEGTLEVQVPDFDHCARAAMSLFDDNGYQCNRCGQWIGIQGIGQLVGLNDKDVCTRCGQAKSEIEDAAIHRLYGGQDYEGNWHQTAFTKDILRRMLVKSGFKDVEELEQEHQEANWNFKLLAKKNKDGWGE